MNEIILERFLRFSMNFQKNLLRMMTTNFPAQMIFVDNFILFLQLKFYLKNVFLGDLIKKITLS